MRPTAANKARRVVANDQRAQMLRASERLVGERGVDALSTSEIYAAAGCSRSTFYAVFGDRGSLLLALFDHLTQRVLGAISVSYRGQETWLEGVRAALFELLAFLDENPKLAHFLLVGSLAGEARMLEHRVRSLQQLAHALDANSPPASGRALPAPFGGEAIVGAVAAVLHARLLEEQVPSLRELGGALMAVIVLPYLGAEAARAELARSLPAALAPGALPRWESVAEPQRPRPRMRLTYRTIGVLAAIAESPRMSNGDVARAVGVVDHSQISRLLARLRRLGLIETDAQLEQRNSRRAWRVTAAGTELLADVDGHLRAPS